MSQVTSPSMIIICQVRNLKLKQICWKQPGGGCWWATLNFKTKRNKTGSMNSGHIYWTWLDAETGKNYGTCLITINQLYGKVFMKCNIWQRMLFNVCPELDKKHSCALALRLWSQIVWKPMHIGYKKIELPQALWLITFHNISYIVANIAFRFLIPWCHG